MRKLTALLVLTLVSSSAAAALAQTPEEAGRKMMAQYGPAVVNVRLAVRTRMSMGGQDRATESKTDAVGTMIDASGLTVLSLSSIDPTGSVGAMMQRQAASAGADDLKMESELLDVKLVLLDGTELAARVVLRDADLDAAFVMPASKPTRMITHVPLTATAVPQLLDWVVALNRLGKLADRTSAVSLERINATVAGPRPYYVIGTGQGTSGLGSPIFNVGGELLGIMLLRSGTPDLDSNIGTLFQGSEGYGLLPVVVPTDQIREMAGQALEAAAKGK